MSKGGRLVERVFLLAFLVFMWPVLLVDWLDGNGHVGWTLGIGWGSALLIVALIVRSVR